jgi:ABC-type phosphate/phosphonate transport system substrate-binding protein
MTRRSAPARWIANARMYAVTPPIEAAWRALLGEVAREADAPLDYLPYPAPQPLEPLWSRPDLGAALMCGYPIALELAPVVPIAAPVPAAEWAGGRALYRTDLIVHREAPYERLEDAFGARAGYTVAHSQSGFNAFRHHLLRYRTPQRPKVFGEMIGDLVTARRILDGVRERRLDLGPLDAYWHLLIARSAPELTADVRVLASTETAPMPAFVAAAAAPAPMVARLRAAFVDARTRPWFPACAEALQIEGFAAVETSTYAGLLDWDRAAKAAGYDRPA